MLMESPGRYHNGQHTLHTPGASDPALCLLQIVIRTVEWTIKEACRLLYTAQFARVPLEDDFSPVPLRSALFCVPRNAERIFWSSRDWPSFQFAADPMTTMNIQHYRLHKTLSPSLSWSASRIHITKASSSLVYQTLSTNASVGGYQIPGNAKKTESVVTLTPTSCKSKPIQKQRDFPTQRLLHFLSPVPAH